MATYSMSSLFIGYDYFLGGLRLSDILLLTWFILLDTIDLCSMRKRRTSADL